MWGIPSLSESNRHLCKREAALKLRQLAGQLNSLMHGSFVSGCGRCVAEPLTAPRGGAAASGWPVLRNRLSPSIR